MRYDIIVGVPSYNEEKTISFVVRQCDRGLRRYFSEKKALIINCDGLSADRTRKIFLSTKTKTAKKSIVPRKTGKGSVFRELFKEVLRCRAKAVMVVDSDLRNITPEWVRRILDPIFKGYDYVVPYYARHKYDGTITNNICFPLVYGLFLRDIRQPIGGEFGFSERMAKRWLKERWRDSTYRFGIDIFMTTGVILSKGRICQVSLGAKIHNPSAPKLSKMFEEVTDSLFSNIVGNEKAIKGLRVKKIPISGFRRHRKKPFLRVDENGIMKECLINYNRNMAKKVLGKEEFERVDGMIRKKKIKIGAELWSKIVYSYLNAYKKAKEKDRLKIVKGLKGLYFARVWSFIKETERLSEEKAERKIMYQAKVFRKNRGMFVG